MSGDGRIPDSAHVEPTDADFRVAQASLDDLVALQVDAENRGLSSRWSSVKALLREVGLSPVYLRPLLRERRNGEVRAYRCLALYSPSGGGGGRVTTFDVSPERLALLPALVLDEASRVALSCVFSRALGGIESTTKD